MQGQGGSRSLHRYRVRPPLSPVTPVTDDTLFLSSVKLKDDRGADRSIAHFYRHVEIFPYFNPAVLLAPALKPLMATASKTMFMGGNGKVNLTAKMHRGTWVAGQRCYVDVNVDNLSSKKVSSPFHPIYVD
jgi:hypothetical protein